MLRRLADSRAFLALGFVAVHVGLIWGNLSGPGVPLADVTHQYKGWVQDGLHGHGWVAIDSEWVYPIGALLPMLITAIGGFHHYGWTWLGLIVFWDAVALFAIVKSTGRTWYGWYWLIFLASLGPIASGRIDGASVPLAILGGLFIATRPAIGGALLMAGAWVKVWPGALLASALTAFPHRRRHLAGAAVVTLVVVLGALAVGGHETFSFLSAQGGRGVQIEAIVATPWLWLAHFKLDGHAIWNADLSTWEITGHGTSTTSALGTPVMGLVTVAICALAYYALRKGAHPAAIFGPLALALTTNLIVTNKVGSPQYEAWLAVPIILGLILRSKGGPSFLVPAGLALVVAALTQVIYPWYYGHLIHLRVWLLLAITARNIGVVALLVIAVADLVVQARRANGTTSALSEA